MPYHMVSHEHLAAKFKQNFGTRLNEKFTKIIEKYSYLGQNKLKCDSGLFLKNGKDKRSFILGSNNLKKDFIDPGLNVKPAKRTKMLKCRLPTKFLSADSGYKTISSLSNDSQIRITNVLEMQKLTHSFVRSKINKVSQPRATINDSLLSYNNQQKNKNMLTVKPSDEIRISETPIITPEHSNFNSKAEKFIINKFFELSQPFFPKLNNSGKSEAASSIEDLDILLPHLDNVSSFADQCIISHFYFCDPNLSNCVNYKSYLSCNSGSDVLSFGTLCKRFKHPKLYDNACVGSNFKK